jgi:dimethylaniline monooxygenase (N-oxide forming)
MFWGSGGIGIASVPDLWKVLHAGDLTIHQTEIESFSHQNVVNLKDGHSIPTDIVVLCTGFDKGYKAFTPELRANCNLYYDFGEQSRWRDLDKRGDEEVDRLLPFLKDPPEPNKRPV